MFAVANRNLLVGMIGFFAGGASTAAVDWPTLPKAGLAMGAAVVVSTAVALLTRERAPAARRDGH